MNLMCCSSSNATKYGGVRKIESVTLAELNSFVLNASPQCFRILQQGFSSFTCASCNEENAVGVLVDKYQGCRGLPTNAVKRSHPCENMRDSDIRGNTADGNGDGQTAAPSEPNVTCS
ncbi:unnamed protein product [Brassica oleracea var. botrytis]